VTGRLGIEKVHPLIAVFGYCDLLTFKWKKAEDIC